MAEQLSVNVSKDEADRLTEEILDVILSLSALDFSKKVNVGYEDSGFNAVAVGLNMLGQELERSVISKQALEGEVAKRTQELSIREKKYRNIFETTSVSIWEQDVSRLMDELDGLRKNGVVDFKRFLKENPDWILKTLDYVVMVDANEASVRMFEAENKANLMKRYREFFTPEMMQSFEQVLMGLAAGELEFDFETMTRSLNGNPLNVMIQIRVPERSAQFSNALMSIVNLTGQRQLEEQLRQSQKMEAIGRLAGGVAHDFNNLLTVILNYGQMLSEDINPGDPMKKRIDAIIESAERAAALTKQLLAFSRKQVIAPKVIDINEVLGKTEKMLQRLLGEDIELINKATEAVWAIKADVSQIEQIVMNLAVNARDAMPQGGKLIIETSNQTLEAGHSHGAIEIEAGDYVVLAVSDTGFGMTPDVQRRIFEPFFTTKELGKGTGLGLATVYGNMKQNQGAVTVYSEVGHGTTFKLYFPRVQEQNLITAQTENNAKELLKGKETILLVEDEDRVRGVAASLLSKNGYKVLEARNGGEALLICEQEKGDIPLMLSDVIMPNMNGKQLADRLKLIRPDMKVVFMSGYTDNVIAENGILEEGSKFIQKPFSPTSLLKLLRETLDS